MGWRARQHKTESIPTVTQPPAGAEEKKLLGKEFLHFIDTDEEATRIGGRLVDELALKIAKMESRGSTHTFEYKQQYGYTFHEQKTIKKLRAIPTDDLVISMRSFRYVLQGG